MPDSPVPSVDTKVDTRRIRLLKSLKEKSELFFYFGGGGAIIAGVVFGCIKISKYEEEFNKAKSDAMTATAESKAQLKVLEDKYTENRNGFLATSERQEKAFEDQIKGLIKKLDEAKMVIDIAEKLRTAKDQKLDEYAARLREFKQSVGSSEVNLIKQFPVIVAYGFFPREGTKAGAINNIPDGYSTGILRSQFLTDEDKQKGWSSAVFEIEKPDSSAEYTLLIITHDAGVYTGRAFYSHEYIGNGKFRIKSYVVDSSGALVAGWGDCIVYVMRIKR
jgi:hypothetical protein